MGAMEKYESGTVQLCGGDVVRSISPILTVLVYENLTPNQV